MKENLQYSPSKISELSTIEDTQSQIYYHFKGNYSLNKDDNKLLPINRSYSADPLGDRTNSEGIKYNKDKLIHEEVNPNSLIKNVETLINIYGKKYLYIQENESMDYHLTVETNDNISNKTRYMLSEIKDGLNSQGFDNQYILGVFGSHQIGLTNHTSDIDLLVWTSWEKRPEIIKEIKKTLEEKMSMKSTLELGMNKKYAETYSKRMNISLEAGHYVANQRNRWIAIDGTPVSLQCLNNNFNHLITKGFFEGLNEDWEIEDFSEECNILSVENSYNLPRTWQLEIGGEKIDAVSLSWTHQGMGDIEDKNEEKHIVKAKLVRSNKGLFIFLRDPEDYILPKKFL